MSDELLKELGFKKGEKAIWFYNDHPQVVIIKDVTENYNGMLILLTEEEKGYLNPLEVYNKDKILSLLEVKIVVDSGKEYYKGYTQGYYDCLGDLRGGLRKVDNELEKTWRELYKTYG